jgi:hypothetical protein
MPVFDALDEMYFASRHSDVEEIVHNESFRCNKVVLVSCFTAFRSGIKECYDGVVHLREIES